jgi:hypothetical protein
MEADKAIDVATASRRVSPMIANTLETKQQAVHKSEAIVSISIAGNPSLCPNCLLYPAFVVVPPIARAEVVAQEGRSRCVG